MGRAFEGYIEEEDNDNVDENEINVDEERIKNKKIKRVLHLPAKRKLGCAFINTDTDNINEYSGKFDNIK
jgi:transcriptional regulator of nitric oxide reductase